MIKEVKKKIKNVLKKRQTKKKKERKTRQW